MTHVQALAPHSQRLLVVRHRWLVLSVDRGDRSPCDQHSQAGTAAAGSYVPAPGRAPTHLGEVPAQPHEPPQRDSPTHCGSISPTPAPSRDLLDVAIGLQPVDHTACRFPARPGPRAPPAFRKQSACAAAGRRSRRRSQVAAFRIRGSCQHLEARLVLEIGTSAAGCCRPARTGLPGPTLFLAFFVATLLNRLSEHPATRRKEPERRFCPIAQQVVAPIERPTECLLPLGQIRGPPLRRSNRWPRRERIMDASRSRTAPRPARSPAGGRPARADPATARRFSSVSSNSDRGPCPLDDRSIAPYSRQIPDPGHPIRIGNAQRRHREYPLSPEWRTARLVTITSTESVPSSNRDQVGRGQNGLEAVQDEQHRRRSSPDVRISSTPAPARSRYRSSARS